MKSNSCLHSDSVENNERAATGFFHVIPGIWIGGKTYWLQQEVEELNLDEGIFLHIRKENVQPNIKMLVVSVTNQSFCPLRAKLIFQYRQKVFQEELSFISPAKNVIFHLANDKINLISGQTSNSALSVCSVQPLWNIYDNEIWACAQSGILKYYPMVHGNPVSFQIFNLDIEENETCIGKSWLISGQCETDLLKLNAMLLKTY